MKKLVIIDSNSLMSRAFYALPLSLVDKNGLAVNAIFGYVNMLSKIINDIKPTHIAAAFDVHAPTFRHEKYGEYKGNRKPTPQELVEQMPVVRELLQKMGINVLQKAGYEADDVIGTLAKRFKATGDEHMAYIISGDKDLLQIVDHNVEVWLTKRGVTEIEKYSPIRFLEAGMTAQMVVEIKALMGDASDNIPGVRGIGEKTAHELIKKYGTIDDVYKNIDTQPGKLKEKLVAGKDLAYLSRELASIDIDAPIDCGEECYSFKYPFPAAAKDMLLELGMRSALLKFKFEDVAAGYGDGTVGGAVEVVGAGDGAVGGAVEVVGVEASVSRREQAGQMQLASVVDLKAVFKKAEVAGSKSLALLVEEGKVFFSFGDGLEYSMSFVTNQDLFSMDGQGLAVILDVISASGLHVIVYDYKALKHILRRNNAALENVSFDVRVAAYLVDSSRNYSNISVILEYFAIKSRHKAQGLYELAGVLRKKLSDKGLVKLYEDIEFPLISALFDMEVAGFAVDKSVMRGLEERYRNELADLRAAIVGFAGEEFNVNSPKQMGVILYQKLGLPTPKANKRGAYSVDAEVLQELKDKHEIVPLILKYRTYNKLLTTYIEGISKLVTGQGKIHTVFNNTLTTTGRLSSQEPNMQNIPVKDDIGREIRKMFVASPSSELVSADYSQIELRLLAHFSEDKNLLEAFNQGQDVHSATAAKIFEVSACEVTLKMRRVAKTVNFGIIYGMSSFGLSVELEISRQEAKKFIDTYFMHHEGVKSYMDANVEFAKKNGYAVTMFGRIRYLPDVRSKIPSLRSFGERAAMNMPLQGTAADIMKIAILRVSNRIKAENLKSKLIMTVHDELVVDAFSDEVDRVKNILKEEMQSVVKLKVPLTVEVGQGKNWFKH